LDLVDWLLRKGHSLSECDNDGNTALLFAAWGGHRALIEQLLRWGSKLDEKNYNGHSVFLSAANGGRIEIVEWLLTKGFSLDETNNNGDTALLLAAYGGHIGLVQRLLQLGASLQDKNSCGFTPLLSAANGGQLEMARWLLENGSSISERDHDGYSPLILAACGGSIELVRFFLERGASLQERNENGDTALLLAAYCGHVDLVAWLLQNGSQLTERNKTGMGLLVSAANGGHIEVVRLVLELTARSSLEDTDDGGYTALLLAAQRGHIEVVQLLAAYGANMQARTKRHRNDARSLAVDSPQMIEYLQYVWSFTPLQIAADARMVDVLHGWLAAGADPRNVPGPSLLEVARTTPPYTGAKAPCNETYSVVHAAVAPWTPGNAPLYGPAFREGLLGVFFAEKMLSTQTHMLQLPAEIWRHIASFIDRPTFTEDLRKVSLEPNRVRGAWRQKRFGLGTTESELELALLTEDDIERPDLHTADPAPNGRASPAIVDSKVAEHTATAAAAGAIAVATAAGEAPRISWV
jgi:ankyrin repeat protein